MNEFKCPRTQGKQERHHMEHADARELRWRCGRYFYFRFTSAILFFTVINIYLCRTYVLWIGRPRKCRHSHWNFKNMLFPTEGFTISGLRRRLGFSYIGPLQYICISGLKLWTKHVYNTKTYMFLMDVAHFWGTFSDHTFPSIFVICSSAILHFRWRVHQESMPTVYSGQLSMKIWK